MSLPSNETVVDDVRRLLAEEAHLIGQEVQDSLGHDALLRRQTLSAVLNELSELFEDRRSR